MDIEDLKTENSRLRKLNNLLSLSNGGLHARIKALEHRSKKRMEKINALKDQLKRARQDMAALKVLYDVKTDDLHSEQSIPRLEVEGAD